MHTVTSPRNDYWCFISYSHADNKSAARQWASWLQQAIETYEVPKDLVGRKNRFGEIIPDRIYPVFRDEDELPASCRLDQSINDAIDRSRTMLVICSPSAALSSYVESEIIAFRKTGRAERLITAIVAGTPGSEFNECFAPALCGDAKDSFEPSAADFRLTTGQQGFTTPAAYRHLLEQDGHDRPEIQRRVAEYTARVKTAKLKIIAGILGVTLGDLAKRDEAHHVSAMRRKQKQLAIAASAMFALLVGAGSALHHAYSGAAEARQALADLREELAPAPPFAAPLSTTELRAENPRNTRRINAMAETLAMTSDAPTLEPGNAIAGSYFLKSRRVLSALESRAKMPTPDELLLKLDAVQQMPETPDRLLLHGAVALKLRPSGVGLDRSINEITNAISAIDDYWAGAAHPMPKIERELGSMRQMLDFAREKLANKSEASIDVVR